MNSGLASKRLGRTSHGLRRAFTMMELLIVIALIAIMLTLGIFAVQGFTSTPLDESSNIVRSAMHFARQYAVTHGVPAYVVFEDKGEFYWDDTTPPPAAELDIWDSVKVVRMRLMKDLEPGKDSAGNPLTLKESPPTAELSFALDLIEEPLFEAEMVRPVEFDYMPRAQSIRVLEDPANPLVTSLKDLKVVRFNPNGTCESQSPDYNVVPAPPAIPSTRGTGSEKHMRNFVALKDTFENKYIYVYVYTSTSYVMFGRD